MAAGRKKSPRKVIYVPAKNVNAFADVITHAINTAEVKTATPSRAQTKIQVRIAWTNTDGKPGLGYLSMSTTDAEKLGRGSSGPTMDNFLDDVFRLPQWAKMAAIDEYGNDADYGAFHEDLKDILKKNWFLNSTSRIHVLYKQAIAAIKECAAKGEHKSARRERNLNKVKAYLTGNIQFALNNGMTDAEIHELVQLAFVKHTMESIDNMILDGVDSFYAGQVIEPVGKCRQSEVDCLLSHAY